MTKNSKIVLEIIESVTCHPTAADVHRLVLEAGHKMSMATVYNSLSSLCEEGKIRKLSHPDQTDRFDKMLRHDHLVCSRCGRISDLFMKDHTALFQEEAGVTLTSYSLTLFNICAECAETASQCDSV